MKEKTQSTRIQGLRLGRLLIIVFVVFALLTGLLVAYAGMQASVGIEHANQQKSRAVLSALTAAMQSAVDLVEQRISALAADLQWLPWPQLDSADRMRLEQNIQHQLPSIIKIQLIPARADRSGMDESFAARYMLLEAAKGRMPPLAYYKTEQNAYLAMARNINDDWQLYVMLSVDAIENSFKSLDVGDGGLQLRQYTDEGEHQVLWHKGQVGAQEPLLLPLANSRWRLAYWPAQSSASVSRQRLLQWGPAVAVLIIAGLVIYWVSFSFNRVLRKDLITVINLARDLTAGRRGGHYPVHLAEFRGTIDVILRSEAERKQRQAATVKKKPQAAPVDLETVDVDDLLFNQESKHNMPDAIPATQKAAATQKAVSPAIFRTYDIRGQVGQDLSGQIARLIGLAIGSEAQAIQQKTVVVGRDGRLSGPEISQYLIGGLLDSGCNVIDIGVVPTPVLYFATHHLPSQSGVMVTGSHNPPAYNGFKIVLGGETLSGAKIQNLRSRIENSQFTKGKGQLTQNEITSQYIGKITADVRVLRPLKVVIDCGNGVAGAVAPQLFQALGCEVVQLFCEVDGHFPNHHPDPSQPENLKELIGAVQVHYADVGLAFDGDGDRLGVVTQTGKIIWPDRQMMLFAKDVLSRNPGAEIVYDVKCSKHLARVITEAGGRPVMWKTGHSLIKARMKQTGALLAGEMSGHIFFKERWYGFDDALYSAARLLEILALDQRSSDEVFADYPDSLNTPELRVELAEGEHYSFMDRLVAEASFPNAQIITIDGLRVEFPDGWGLVRASNTTPTLILRFEADHEIALSRIQDQFRDLLLKVDPGLSIPF